MKKIIPYIILILIFGLIIYLGYLIIADTKIAIIVFLFFYFSEKVYQFFKKLVEIEKRKLNK